MADATVIGRHPDLIAMCEKLLSEQDHDWKRCKRLQGSGLHINDDTVAAGVPPCTCWKSELGDLLTRLSGGQLGLFR